MNTSPTTEQRISDITLAQYAEWAETRATEEKIPVMVNFHLTLASALRELQRLRLPPEPAAECKDCDKLMTERDDATDQADKLAECIEGLLGIDIGEHSSGNAPWQNAIDAAEYELDKRKRASETKAPKQAICPNCDADLPKGCGGVFRNEGESCALNWQPTNGGAK